MFHPVFDEEMLGVKFPGFVYHEIDETPECRDVEIRAAREGFYLQPVRFRIIRVEPEVGRSLPLVMDMHDVLARHPFVKPFFEDVSDDIILFDGYPEVAKIEFNGSFRPLHPEVLDKGAV